MITKDLGVGSAYGEYLSKGGTKTEQEFAAMFLDFEAGVDGASASASAAAQSAIAASNSETRAASSAGLAAESAQSAEQFATVASGAAAGVHTDAERASAAANESENIRDEISSKVSIATQAVSNANTSAISAANSANSASSSADIAAQKAQEIVTSAAQAAQDRTDAQAAASAAQSARTDALAAAGNAAISETNAGASAQTASQKAADATAAVQTATQKAAAANESAVSASGSADTATTKATEATTAATRAQSYAKGDTNSRAGETTDNALYYKEQAAASAAAAAASAATLTVDSELSTTSENPVQNKVITTKVDELKNELKQGLSQINSSQIVGMTETGDTTVSTNLFQYAGLVGEGKSIYSIANGKVTLADNANYNTYVIAVDGENTYTFTNCRSAVVISDLDYTAVGTILTYRTSVDSTGGEYIIFCFNPSDYPVASYSITKPENKYYIPNNWDISRATIETPQIDGMLPTGKMVQSSNLFAKASLVGVGKYVDRVQNGKAVIGDNANYNTYIIPVDGESTYTFTNARTAAVVSDLEYNAVGGFIANATSIDATGGAYILWSFNPTTYPVSDYKITKPVAEYTVPNNWNLPDSTKTTYQRITGSIASGGKLDLTGKTAVKYGQQIALKAFISTFNAIKLAFYNYNNSVISNAIEVTVSNVVIYVGTTAVETLPHGLTISNDIAIVVDYTSENVKITVYSNGESFSTTTTFERLTSGVVSPSVVSDGTVCTDATLEISVPRAKKPIWYFGDSYISYTNPARWAHYLVDAEFDGSTLLNGYAGGTSATTVFALTALLQYGTPDYAVFATGMNDGSDTDSAPSTSWVNARNNFLALCESNGITPIFTTVPTVPSVNNNQKNAWVRASGYKYIDFAKAVGADGTGAWYTGMLSSDNVHPTEAGAKALYTQVLADFPEILAV